ncbi:MAG: PH domain-containing protein [Actinobacteria bacterium]|nr:PH domain-containing protein [Actinomycetota bacterium]
MSDVVVTARPRLMSRVGYGCAAVVLIVFVVTALVMKTDNAGATFGDKDQIGTVVVGVILAGLFIMPTRPRLRADAEAVRMRSFLGGWRVVPWDLVVRVEFPRSVRFARLVLPGEETLAIYAVQRMDGELAVTAMQELRQLFAQTHPGA